MIHEEAEEKGRMLYILHIRKRIGDAYKSTVQRRSLDCDRGLFRLRDWSGALSLHSLIIQSLSYQGPYVYIAVRN
jgi:hypothetical protein